MVAESNKLTNMQLELLKIFKYKLNETQLLEIRDLLRNYFISKIDEQVQNVWDSEGWDENTVESFANLHFRTAYK